MRTAARIEDMAALDRIYERTALEAPSTPARRIALAARPDHQRTHAATIRAGMRRYSDERITELLTELEALQLVRSVAATKSTTSISPAA